MANGVMSYLMSFLRYFMFHVLLWHNESVSMSFMQELLMIFY